VIRIREYEKKLVFLGGVLILLNLVGFLSGDATIGMMALYVGFELVKEVNNLNETVESLEKQLGQGDRE